MSQGGGPLTGLARFRHPRLVVLIVLGALLGLSGALLALLDPASDLGLSARRLAIAGAIVFLFGASGIVAFAIFERGFD